MQFNTIIHYKLIIPEENNTSRQGGEENENTSTHWRLEGWDAKYNSIQ